MCIFADTQIHRYRHTDTHTHMQTHTRTLTHKVSTRSCGFRQPRYTPYFYTNIYIHIDM